MYQIWYCLCQPHLFKNYKIVFNKVLSIEDRLKKTNNIIVYINPALLSMIGFNKDKVVGQLVTETVLSLRTYLINEKVKELQLETKKSNEDNSEILKEINDYHKLKSLLSKKLNRVI